MNIYLQPEDLEVLSFYPYPSCILCDIAEYDEMWNEGTGDKHCKSLFNTICKMAEAKYGCQLMDNKIAFKFRHIPSDTILYIGYKDGIYKVGLKVFNESNFSINLL